MPHRYDGQSMRERLQETLSVHRNELVSLFTGSALSLTRTRSGADSHILKPIEGGKVIDSRSESIFESRWNRIKPGSSIEDSSANSILFLKH